jgi:hypothetical protein
MPKTLPNTWADALYGTVRDYPEGVPALAETLGYSAAMLYRCTNATDDGAHFDAMRLPALIRATGDNRAVRYLCHVAGGIFVKLPRVRKAKEEAIAELQQRQAQAVKSLLGFFAGTASQVETLEAIKRELEGAAGFLKAVEAYRKPTLFEDEP